MREDVPGAATFENAAADFVELFESCLRAGAPDSEQFFARYCGRMTEDALLVQPLAPAARGPAGVRKIFEPLFAAIPDLRGEVQRWGQTTDGVLIELVFRGTVGSKPLVWRAVDRIVLRDGLVAERHSYFDPLPLLLLGLRRPIAAARLLPRLIGR